MDFYHPNKVGDEVVLPLAHMKDIGGAHAVRALQAQGQTGGGLSVRAGFDGLAAIVLTPQFLKYGHALDDHKRTSVEKLGGIYSAGRGIPRSRER